MDGPQAGPLGLQEAPLPGGSWELGRSPPACGQDLLPPTPAGSEPVRQAEHRLRRDRHFWGPQGSGSTTSKTSKTPKRACRGRCSETTRPLRTRSEGGRAGAALHGRAVWRPRLSGAGPEAGCCRLAGAEPGRTSLPRGAQAAARAAASIIHHATLRSSPTCPSASPPGNARGGGRSDDGDGDGRSASRARPRPPACPSRDHAAGSPQLYAALVNRRALDGRAPPAAAASRCEGDAARARAGDPAGGRPDLRLPAAPQTTRLRPHGLRHSGPARGPCAWRGGAWGSVASVLTELWGRASWGACQRRA